MKILKQIFGPTSKEIIDRAFMIAATLEADCMKQAKLVELYGALVASIDHTKDWWSYAHAKEALHVASTEYVGLRERADSAIAQANALLVSPLQEATTP